MISELKAGQLTQACTAQELKAAESAGGSPATPAAPVIGQPRAREALRLGLGIDAEGFNTFVTGIPGTGRLTAVKGYLEELARAAPSPPDWCYVYNFQEASQPRALSLPAGRACQLKEEMKRLVGEAMQALVRAFESEEYASRRRRIAEHLEQQQALLTSAINEKAARESLLIKQTPWEVFSVPLRSGEPMTDDQFNALPVAEQHRIQEAQSRLAGDITEVLQQTRRLEKEARQQVEQLEQDVARLVIGDLVSDIRDLFKDLAQVVAYLDSVQQDIIGHLPEFLVSQKPEPGTPVPAHADFLKRYDINILVDQAGQQGAPVIIERNPTYNNLIGCTEKESVLGNLVTDFTMIRAGSLHRANGGFLVIRAEELFRTFYSWEALKRALRNREVTLEDLADQLGYLSIKTLRPEPVPLQVKVILVGAPTYYYLLYQFDADFRELFKIRADFDTEMERTPQYTAQYLDLVERICQREGLPVPDPGARALLVEYGSRLAGDQQKLSTRFGELADILREAGHYARSRQAAFLGPEPIRQAIDQKQYRSSLVQEKILDLIRQQQLLVETTGRRTGQVNGLSVIELGDLSFGRPTRITCTVSPGRGGIIAIEREAELSGPLHTKGVLILAGYLSGQFAQEKPLSLTARITFEQNYSPVDGDSASSTELYALLSSLSGLPLRQDIAVTGSVNQQGQVQAVGGINEKIEGYFELCRLQGLTGDQGVLVPGANLRNLMLKEPVLEAVEKGQFHIWAADRVEEGIELLSGRQAGSPREEGTVFGLVQARLAQFAEALRDVRPGESPDGSGAATQQPAPLAAANPAPEAGGPAGTAA
ncbi:MAG TPA: ATP-binding protein [Chitinophagaceae bacterium]|nr:ATP-binding protein [Chitinophagaceae bacterium]